MNCDIIKVKILSSNLLKPSNYDEQEKVWTWNYNDIIFYYDIGEKCKAKVIDVKFKTINEINEIEKNNHNIEENIVKENEDNLIEEGQKDIINITRDMIMEIYCTMNEEGLGPNKWWNIK